MKKRKIGLVLIALCMLCAMSVTAMAATNEVQEKFSFELYGGGEKDVTPIAVKQDNANYARIEFKYFSNPTGKPLLYRLRSVKPNYDPCSNLYTVNSVSTQRPGYWAGYGINGNEYVFRIQTDSSTVDNNKQAVTYGIWVP